MEKIECIEYIGYESGVIDLNIYDLEDIRCALFSLGILRISFNLWD